MLVDTSVSRHLVGGFPASSKTYGSANARGVATYTFQINAAGLAAVNLSDELVLGLVMPQLGPNTIYVNSTPQLHLTGVSDVPLPASAWLFSSVLLVMGHYAGGC